MIEVKKKYYNLRKVNISPKKKEKKMLFLQISYGFIHFIILKLFARVCFILFVFIRSERGQSLRPKQA